MQKIITVLGFLVLNSAANAGPTQVDGNLVDECIFATVQLEEMFLADDMMNDFNPSISTHISKMQMLVDMVSFCSVSGLTPMTESMVDKLKKKVL